MENTPENRIEKIIRKNHKRYLESKKSDFHEDLMHERIKNMLLIDPFYKEKNDILKADPVYKKIKSILENIPDSNYPNSGDAYFFIEQILLIDQRKMNKETYDFLLEGDEELIKLKAKYNFNF